jgi:hypothetical protein
MARATAAPPARAWRIEERARNIHKIRVDLPRVGDEFWCLLQSDVHWDNPKCDREMFMRHLEEAKERDAIILDNGDFFCAMQGRFDPRASKNDLRPEHQRADYLDALVTTAADALAPYKDLLGVRGMGNHETSILKRHETNLTERLVERLKQNGSKTVALGGYSGYVVFEVKANQTRTFSYKLHYHHGYGGGGPVTRGVIQTNRQAVYLADADIVLSGHTHDAWIVPIQRVRLNNETTGVEHIRQLHLRVPGYKEEYGDGFGGWHIERGGPPKPIGAAWLRIRYARATSQESIIEWDVTEAR